VEEVPLYRTVILRYIQEQEQEQEHEQEQEQEQDNLTVSPLMHVGTCAGK
jgi:hypothetical protein